MNTWIKPLNKYKTMKISIKRLLKFMFVLGKLNKILVKNINIKQVFIGILVKISINSRYIFVMIN